MKKIVFVFFIILSYCSTNFGQIQQELKNLSTTLKALSENIKGPQLKKEIETLEPISWQDFKKKIKENDWGVIHPSGRYYFLYFTDLFKGINNEKHLSNVYEKTKEKIYNNLEMNEKSLGGAVSLTRVNELAILAAKQITESSFWNDLEFDLLAQNYKIHLMPLQKNIVAVANKIVEACIKDPSLKSLIYQFKLNPNNDISPGQTEILPAIVIYPASGKKNAQELLNKLYALLENIEGINVCPRYNATVTSLIYVAQGDGDDKTIELLDSFYEKPNKIYYDYKKIKPDNSDHYLRHPKTNKPLTECLS